MSRLILKRGSAFRTGTKIYLSEIKYFGIRCTLIGKQRFKTGYATTCQMPLQTSTPDVFNGSPVEETSYMLFAGREVRVEKNCARGLEYGPRPQAEGFTQDQGHSFSQYRPT